MSHDQLLQLLEKFVEDMPIEVREDVHMRDGDGPLLDADGEQVINDVVLFGDARVYIERDDNDPEGVQDFIDMLSALGDHMPDIVEALRHYWQTDGPR